MPGASQDLDEAWNKIFNCLHVQVAYFEIIVLKSELNFLFEG